MRDEFPKYITLLKEECQKVTDLEATRNNGLIPPLFYLAAFGERESVIGTAEMLLNEIPKLSSIETAPVTKSPLYQVKKKPLPVILEARQSLSLLKEVKAASWEKSYLPDTCARYLQQKPYPSFTPVILMKTAPKLMQILPLRLSLPPSTKISVQPLPFCKQKKSMCS